MIFMIQILKKIDGTYNKGTSQYETEREALTALYVAMSSAMAKDDTASIMCMLTDEFGSQKKREYWAAPAEVAEEIIDE